MKTKFFWSIAIDALWTWIVGGLFGIIGIAAVIFPNIGAVINWSSLTKYLPGYFLISIGIFVWSLGFVCAAAKRVYVEPQLILELSKIRTEGILLLDKVDQLKSFRALKKLTKQYEEWENRMLAELGKLSKSWAEDLAHIRNYEIIQSNNDFNFDQTNLRSVIQKKLDVLERFIYDYRKRLIDG
jgi:hypothetical protein